MLNAWTGLARAVRLCGNFPQARDLGLEATVYGLHELGPEHYLTLRAATDLSIAMRRIPANYDEALELAADTLEQCRLRRGEQNPDTMAAAISLYNIQRVVGQIDSGARTSRGDGGEISRASTAPSTPTITAASETSHCCADWPGIPSRPAG